MSDQVDSRHIAGWCRAMRDIYAHGLQRNEFLLEFLYPVFAKKPQPSRKRFDERLCRMRLGDRHQLYLVPGTASTLARSQDYLFDLADVLRDRGARTHEN